MRARKPRFPLTPASEFLKADHRTDGMKSRTWGGWRYEAATCVLAMYRDGSYVYEVDLERCGTAAAALDWIAQVGSKGWCTPTDLGHLVRALDDLLDLQQNLCACALMGGPQQARAPINVKRVIAAMIGPEPTQ